MKFCNVPIGKKFIHETAGRLYAFRKKSKSGAYVLDGEFLQPIHLTVTFARCDKTGSILEFGATVEVHPLEG